MMEALQLSSEMIWHYSKIVDGQATTYCGRYADVGAVKSVDENWAKVCKKCKMAKDKETV